jgi:hypothetical protein
LVLISFSGLINVIGAGAVRVAQASKKVVHALNRQITVFQKHSRQLRRFLGEHLAISSDRHHVTILGPPIAQAADYWGRKWFVVTTTLLGFAG